MSLFPIVKCIYFLDTLESHEHQPQMYHSIEIDQIGFFPICYDAGTETGGAVRIFTDDALGVSVTATTPDGRHIEAINLNFRNKNFLINTKGLKVGNNELVVWESFKFGRLTSSDVEINFEENLMGLRLRTKYHILNLEIARREFEKGGFFLTLTFPRLNSKDDKRGGIIGHLRKLVWEMDNILKGGEEGRSVEEKAFLTYRNPSETQGTTVSCNLIRRSGILCCQIDIEEVIGHIDKFSV